MSFSLEWSIEGEKQLSRVLMNLQADTKNLYFPFKKAGDLLRRTYESDVFKTRGGVIQERWKPLSPVTLAQKARSGFPSTPLIATGDMQRSFRSRATSDMALVYNTSDYFKYHQSNRPRKKLPRRVMMKLGTTQREQVIKIFHTHIYRSLKRK